MDIPYGVNNLLESKLEDQICSAVHNLGGIAIKVESPSKRGRADRLIILPGGVVFFVEVKRPDGKGQLSSHQLQFARDVRDLGVPVYVISQFEEFAAIIAALQRDARLPASGG